jgi:hypothetical protein
MASASDSSRAWRIAENGRATALIVQLRQRVYVLPWSLFLYAEGTDAEVKAQFHTHVVLVQGAGLTSLLCDVAGQFVSQLVEPDRNFVGHFPHNREVGTPPVQKLPDLLIDFGRNPKL